MTGASGFVGSAVCKELVRNGFVVIAIVRRQSRNIVKAADDRIRVVYCEMSDFASLPDLITDRDIDVFYHLAWEGSSGNQRGNVDVQMKNVQFTCETIRACSELKCNRFVFASSIMEYEIAAVMATEETPGMNTLYSSAKIAADYMARTIAGHLGIAYIRAVISNVYGPGEKSARLVNTSLRKMLNGERCAFSAGEQLYDFIYIEDAAKAFYEIGEKGAANRTYYIGSPCPRKLKEFLLEMRDCVDPNIEIGLGEIPFNGVSLSYKEFDIKAVKNDTGFEPDVFFSEGIKRTLSWLKEGN